MINKSKEETIEETIEKVIEDLILIGVDVR